MKHPYNPYTSWQAMQAAMSALRQEPPPRADHHLKCSIPDCPKAGDFSMKSDPATPLCAVHAMELALSLGLK